MTYEQFCDMLARHISEKLDESFKGQPSNAAASLLWEVVNTWNLQASQLPAIEALLAERNSYHVRLALYGKNMSIQVTLPRHLQPPLPRFVQ